MSVEPRPVREEDVRAYVERALERLPEEARPGQRRLYEEIAAPGQMPAHAALVAAPEEHLWVERYAPPGEGPKTWTVFAHDGRPMGTVTTPEGVDVLEVGRDYLLGTGTDDLDRRTWRSGGWSGEGGGNREPCPSGVSVSGGSFHHSAEALTPS